MQAHLKNALLSVLLFGAIGVVALPFGLRVDAARAQEHGYPAHLGDLMNESMQVHHTKLWLAGQAGNWPLAAFEVRKLKETVEEVKEAIVQIQASSPKWHRVPVGEMLSAVDAHLDGLDQAVKEKNATKFTTAYRELTAACNACHVRAGERQIKIIEPRATGGVFIDQDFTVSNP